MLRRRQQGPPAQGPSSSPIPTATDAANSTSVAPEAIKEKPSAVAAWAEMDSDVERRPLLGDAQPVDMRSQAWTQRNQWILWAVASGACAAFNGVFAKL
jgi:hypothetical protein